MKRNTPGHPKMLALASALKIPRYQAVGIVESLWHLTAQYAKPGNIGKWPDTVIAESIGFEISRASDLVVALTESGWLDKHDEHRLVVHDWYEHAEDAVHLSLARSTQLFATGQVPRMTRMSQSARDAALAAYEAPKERTECAQDAPKERTALALANASALATANATAKEESTPAKPKAKPKNPTPKKPKPDPFEGWPEFWAVYPRPVGNAKAKEQWRIMECAKLNGAVTVAVENQLKWGMFDAEDIKFVPHPATWLHQKRWEDKEPEKMGALKPPPGPRQSDMSPEMIAEMAERRKARQKAEKEGSE